MDDDNIYPSEVADAFHYHGEYRPQVHYTPIQGHIGDATGLIYYKGEYHLFYMYDPWSMKRKEHKTWGHAVSTDCLHWQELPPILDTLIDHRPGSGCGVVDWNNSSGLRRGPEKTLIIYYTDYEQGTCIAYSVDKGRTWLRHKLNPILEGTEDIRDPLVFWYTPANAWRMVRYEKRGFAFYASTDLLHWAYLSRMEGFYECPDLFQLPVDRMPTTIPTIQNGCSSTATAPIIWAYSMVSAFKPKPRSCRSTTGGFMPLRVGNIPMRVTAL